MLKTIFTVLLLSAAILLTATATADASANDDDLNGVYCERIADTEAFLCSVSDEESESGSTEYFIFICLGYVNAEDGTEICVDPVFIDLPPAS